MAAPAGTTPVFTIRGPLARSDIAGLCARLQTLLSECVAVFALCEVDTDVEADLVAVDAFARLQLGAHRRGRTLRLNGASKDVHDLLAFVGLADELGLEPRWEPEQREEPLGIQEERELDDPPV